MIEGLPSIQALNAQVGRATQGMGGPNDPNAQGDKGVANQQSTAPNESGPQPEYTQPQDHVMQFDDQGNMV